MRTVLVTSLLVLLAGCGANVFEVEVSGESTLQGDPTPLVPDLLGVFPPVSGFANLDFNQTQEFQNQGVTKDQVSSVKMRKVSLRIVSPDDQDFSFLDELVFTARIPGQQTQVARKSDIAALGLRPPNPTLELDVNEDAELAPYVTAESMTVGVDGRGRLPAKDTRLEATVAVEVTVKLF